VTSKVLKHKVLSALRTLQTVYLSTYRPLS